MTRTETHAPSSSEVISAANYSFLQECILRGSGIVIEPGKQYLLAARLGPIARREKLSSLDELCRALRAPLSSVLQQEVIEAMTTNETFFFRDPPQYDALRGTVLPALMHSHRAANKLSFWSAAASSGQEVYSLAMMLTDMGLASSWKLRLVGTDFSEQILMRARTGRYSQFEVNRGLPVQYLVRAFDRQAQEWQLKEEFRRMVEFQQFDLRRPTASLGSFDVVFCRNVLIYFDRETKIKILEGIRATMALGGWLLLGSSENLWGLSERFERRVIGKATLYQAV